MGRMSYRTAKNRHDKIRGRSAPPMPGPMPPPPPDIGPGIPQRPPDTPSVYSFGRGWYSGPPIRSFETYPPRKVTAYRDSPFDTDVFLSIFPEFGENKLFDRAMMEGCGKRAWFYCCKFSQCDQLDGDDRFYAQCLMTAHILVLLARQRAVVGGPQPGDIPGLPPGVQMVGGRTSATGQMGTTGIVTSASIGGESVSLTLPQSQSAWEFWLNQTMYGIEYQAFMSSHVPVGIYSEGDDLRLCLRD